MHKIWFVVAAFLLIVVAIIVMLITGDKNESILQPNGLSSQVLVAEKQTCNPEKKPQTKILSLNKPAGPKVVEDKEDIGIEKANPRDQELARKLGLVKEKDNPVLKMLKTYSKEELDLLARIQRQVGDVPIEPINEIFEMNRQKKGTDELLIKADNLFDNNNRVRTIVRKWIRDIYGVTSNPPAQPIPPVIKGPIKK